MKTSRLILPLFAAVVIFSTACDGLLSDLLKFNSQWYPVDFSLNPSHVVGDTTFVTDVMDANLDSALAAHGFSRENLRSVRMSDAKISVLTKDYTFDPVTRFEFFMDSPGLGMKKVAWLDTVPRGVTTIELDLNNDDLSDYMIEDSFIFTAKGYVAEQVTGNIDFLAEIRYVMQGGLGQ